MEQTACKTVILVGGSGMLGRLLAPFLADRGWLVHVLSRNPLPPRDPRILTQFWDGHTLGEWTRLLAGSYALINLAGRSVNCRYTPKNRRAIWDSRIGTTRLLARAIAQCIRPPQVWLNASTATIYRHTFGPAWGESGEIAPTPEAKDAFSIDVARAWEKAFFENGSAGPAAPPIRKVALRTAIVLANDPDNMLTILLRLAKLGLGGQMGDGRQWVSWVHEEDFCRAVEFLLAPGTRPAAPTAAVPPLTGPVNIASPHPLTNAQLMRAIRALARRHFGLPARRWMLEVGTFFLRTETELILKSRRVIPEKLTTAGFTFLHPLLEPAVRDLLGAENLRSGLRERCAQAQLKELHAES